MSLLCQWWSAVECEGQKKSQFGLFSGYHLGMIRHSAKINI